MKRLEKKLKYYLKKEYPAIIIPCEEGGFFAEIPDLPGCMTQAETWEELKYMIKDAIEVWIISALKDGIEPPLPKEEEKLKKAKEEIYFTSEIPEDLPKVSQNYKISTWKSKEILAA